MNKFSAVFLLFVAGLVWGFGFVVVKEGVENYGVFSFLTLRFAVGTLVLLPFALRRLDRKTWLLGSGIGLVLFLAFVLQTAGLRMTSVSKSGLITSLFLLFAILINRLIFGVKVNRMVWLLIPISLTGLSILTFGSLETDLLPVNGLRFLPDSSTLLGDFLTVLCAVMYGLHIVLLDRFGGNLNAISLTFVQLAVVCVCSGIGVPVFEGFAWPDNRVWLCVLFCGIFCSAICYFIQTFSQKYISATLTAFVLMCEPIFTVFFGVTLKNDSFSYTQMLGAMMMLVATTLIINLPEPGRHAGEIADFE